MAGAGVLVSRRDVAAQKRQRYSLLPAWLLNWNMVSVLLVSVGLAVLALYLFSPDWFRLQRLLPVGLGSPLRADYSADPFALAQAPVAERIIAEALVDRQEAGEDQPPVQLATLIAPLSSPVPSTTPVSSSTPGVVLTLAPTSGPQPSDVPPTRTPAASATASGSATPTITTSASPTKPLPTLLSTLTPTAETYRPSPTSGTIHTPTRIPATATAPATPLPTASPAATATSVPPATATPVPPTAAPTATAVPPATATQAPYPPPYP